VSEPGVYDYHEPTSVESGPTLGQVAYEAQVRYWQEIKGVKSSLWMQLEPEERASYEAAAHAVTMAVVEENRG